MVEDGHTTGNKPHITSDKVIEHYNWTWRNMIPTEGRLNVVDFDSLKLQLI